MTLIGFGGYALSGKDASAKHLRDRHGFELFFMSHGVNEALLKINPLIPYHQDFWDVMAWSEDKNMRYAEFFERLGGYDGYERAKGHPEVRTLLQKVGTEMGRTMFGEDVWTGWLAQRLVGTNASITGIRYRNEINWIRSMDGIALWVQRPGFGPVNTHSSDNSLGPDDFDATIDNAGTLDDLGRTLDHVLVALDTGGALAHTH